ncbi:MAG: TIGR01459 family HAD-type hydrolase, partial [Rhodobacterales bacterium]|nr:TIGR01459 family HAD-type hydrolase [Rhodobacterales bacterium]
MPTATFPKRSTVIANLAEIADQIDVFLLDVFGVLSVGNGVIPGAVDAVTALQKSGKQVFVLTNSASTPATETLAKYRNWGFDFSDFEVTSSRGTLAQTMTPTDGQKWGVMAPSLPVDCVLLGDDPAIYDRVDGIVLLSSAQWMVLSRLRSGLFRAMFAMKEIRNGNEL